MRKLLFSLLSFRYLRYIFEGWIQFALVAKASLEEITNAVHISLKVEVRVLMLGGNHLWKINDNGLTVVLYHYIELVEVAVYNTVIRQSDNQIHELVVQRFHILHFAYVTSAK